MQRRNFIRHSSLSLSALLLHDQLFSFDTPSDRKIKLGVIGCGSRGVGLMEVLKETPVKDLRKAVGINDRFLFINELFRGDESMYERSIKTINSFNIYPEAEYWINRELKVKLGWNSDSIAVQHFYQLVKRRFS